MTRDEIDELLAAYKTPFYCYDGRILKERLENLRQMLPTDARICYAVKANTFILRELACEDVTFEVCSPGELAICKELDIPLDRLVISGVYKEREVFEDVFKSKASPFAVTIESLSQFELIKELAYKYKKQVTLLLRLTSGNQFGLDREDIFKIVKACGKLPLLKINGIQFYSGTQKNSLKKIAREITLLDNLIDELREACGFEVCEIEYGGGFPVSYFDGEKTEESVLFEGFCSLIEEMKNKVTLNIEVGRTLAAQCGFYLTKVVDVKKNKGVNYAVVDGGINHLVYFGQSLAMKTPCLELLPPKSEQTESRFCVCGSLCTANDILIKQFDFPLEVGDVIIFKKVGAYCAAEGISLFLSRKLPGVILKSAGGKVMQLREQEQTYKFNF